MITISDLLSHYYTNYIIFQYDNKNNPFFLPQNWVTPLKIEQSTN